MTIIHNLLDTAYQDTEFLLKNNDDGDQLHISREVVFTLFGKDLEKVQSFTEFINDNQYGEAGYEETDCNYRIAVVIDMPATQNLICSLSALMTCLAELFGVDYDGWDCDLIISES